VSACHEEANVLLRSCLGRLDIFPAGDERQSLQDMCSFVLERSY